jgi:hypothetical protein
MNSELRSYVNAMARKKSAGAKYFGKPLTADPDDAPELLGDFFRQRELR